MRRGKAAAATKSEGESGGSGQQPPAPYENAIKPIATVSTVEEFWSVYDYLKRPSDLPTTTDYHFFRAHIKPTWEDKNNEKGGKWIVRLPKGLSSRYFEEMLLAVIGNQIPGVMPDEICGIVISIRYSEDVSLFLSISIEEMKGDYFCPCTLYSSLSFMFLTAFFPKILGIWNKNNDREVIGLLRDAIKKVLNLPPQANMEYKPHQAAMQDKSSFRNTEVWKSKASGGRERSDSRAESGRRSGGNAWSGDDRKKGNRDAGGAWRWLSAVIDE